MPNATSITDAIRESAVSAKRTKINRTEVEEHDLDSLIRADRYVKGEQAAQQQQGGMGIVFQQIVPPGAG